MVKKARKKSKAKPAKRAKRAKPRARAKVRAKKPAPARKAKYGSAFQIMIDTINETERLRAKREPRGSDETQ
jgi:hypothetical protein